MFRMYLTHLESHTTQHQGRAIHRTLNQVHTRCTSKTIHLYVRWKVFRAWKRRIFAYFHLKSSKNSLVSFEWPCVALNVSNTSETLCFDISNTSRTHFKKVLKIFFSTLKNNFFGHQKFLIFVMIWWKNRISRLQRSIKKFLGVLDPQCGCFSHAPASGLSSALWIKSIRHVQTKIFQQYWKCAKKLSSFPFSFWLL